MMTDFDKMFKKDPLFKRLFDHKTVHGRFLTFFLPILYIIFVIVGSVVLNAVCSKGSDAALNFAMGSTFGLALVGIVGTLFIQGVWWVFTGHTKWDWD